MRKTTLKDLFSIEQGYAFKSSRYVKSGKYVLCTLGNISEDNNFKFNPSRANYYPDEFPRRFILEAGDLILPLTEQAVGLFGNSAFIPQTDEFYFVLNQRVGKIVPKSGVSKRYLHYLLSTGLVKQQIEATASGTSQRNTSPEKIYEVTVWVPSESAQESIGDFLFNIEEQINVNNQVNDNLQAMLQTLYGYWFLQFDFPDENGRPYRSSGGRMVWNDQLKREIPAGWRVASLVSNPLCEPLKPGIAPFSEKTYLATADVVGTTIKDGSRIRYETREGRANMEPVLHSVWFAKMKGSVKHLFLNEACASLISETILSTGFVGLKCEPVAFEYIASFIASEQFEPLKDLHAHGATQQAVNNTDLENILLPIPDAETLRRFSQLASSTLSRFNASIVENKRLQELRDWLLPMLMNGQATVASSDKLSFI